mgnify:CR=1 FL=1
MASKAYYGCEFCNYNSDSLSHSEFVDFLAKNISFKPKSWNLVKFTHDAKSENVDDGINNKFNVIFNHIIDEDEFNEFIEPFKDLELTSVYGLQL